MAGSLLHSCEILLEKGIHPTTISEGFIRALKKSLEIIETLHDKVELSDRERLI